MKIQTARNEYFTFVKVGDANGWRNAIAAHPNLARARGYAVEQAEHHARHGLRAEVRIYAAVCIDCISADATAMGRCAMSDAATKRRTHGKSRTAADTANARRTWRETVRKGERVLIGPDGRMYLGTAKEVRDAALTPAIRDELAGRLHWIRYVEAESRYTTEGRRDAMRKARRHAISRCASDGGSSILFVRMGESLRMLMTAGARLAGNTLDEYLAGMFRREIDALLDAAEARTGRREIPLTRHERAAMERLRTASPATGGMV